MTLSKRILSVLMAMLMVFSVVQIGASAIDLAAGDDVANTKAMVDNGEGRYVLPAATLTSSPTIRVANTSAGKEFYGGTSIVKATPSGVPETTGNFTKEAYSGEVPEYPTVTFECDLSLANDKGSVSLSSNVTGLTYDLSNPTNNKWVWTIKGGTIAAGTYADFTVSFTYTHKDQLTGKTETKSYKVYASSYVDTVAQPAGAYDHGYRTKPAFHAGTSTEMVYRILAKNAKGSYYETGTDVGQDIKDDTFHYAHGVYNFKTPGAEGWGQTAAAYPNGGLVLVHADDGDGGKWTNKDLDRQRPVSSIYIDKSQGTALNGSNINLRYAAFDEYDAKGNSRSSDYKEQIDGITVLAGEQSYSSSTPNEVSASNEINFALEPGSAITFHNKSTYNTSSPYAITNSNTGKVYALNIPFNGTAYANSSNMTTLPDGNQYISYTFLNSMSARYYYNSDGRTCDVHTAVNLRFYLYNKASLRGAIDDALSADTHIPTQPAFTGAQVGLTPQPWYYDNTDGCWDTYLAALKTAQRINARYDVTQNQIASAITNLDAAVANLKVAKADYSAANVLLYGDASQQIIGIADKDANLYTSESWAKVVAAQKALGNMDYTVFYQPLVDKLTADLQKAIDELVYEDADFTRVDTAISYAATKAPYDVYTAASVNALQDLIDLANSADFRAMNITKQDYIDQVADQIYAAADALVYDNGDYTQIDALVSEYTNTYVPNKDLYTDATWGAYEGTIESVIRGIKKNQQFLIDEMADDIIAARDKLAYKPADYTAVDAIIKEAKALKKADYTTASWNALQAAINSVDEELLIPDQAIVDGYVTTIRAKINALEFAAGDYSAVIAQKERFEEVNKDWYTQDSLNAVQTAINNVVEGLKKDKQAQIDGYAAAIKTAIDNLVLKGADYTAANEQIARYNALNRSLYKTGSLGTAMSAYNTLSQNMNLTIDKQSTVDGYVAALKNAIDNLELKDGNYTAVNSAIDNANALLAAADTYAANNNNNPYYTPATRKALEDAVNAVVTGLKIDKQSQIDGYATAINSAINGLVCNTADYTAVNAAKASVPADLDSGRYVAAKVTAVKNALNAVVEGLLTDEQDTVNGYATAINNAVNALALNGADYSGVEAAIASKPADLSPYTSASVKKLNDAISAVVYGLTIDDQTRVDGFAAAILAAINALELDKADYTAVETAKTAANAALNSADAQYYTDASKKAVTDAVDAVVYDLVKAEQSRVDGFATAINNAVKALAFKNIDRTAYDAAVARFTAIDTTPYTDASVKAVTDKIAEGANLLAAANVNIKKQADLDAIVAALNTAIDNLALKGADYTAVNAKISEANVLKVNKDLYVDFSGVEAAVDAVVTGLSIDKQTTVDGFAAAIDAAIKALEFKGIDTATYEAAKATIPADLTNYTADSVKAVEDQIAEIDTFLKGDVDINDQATLDAMVATLNTKIAALALKGADYSALNAVIDEFLALDESLYSNYDDAYDVYLTVKNWKAQNGSLQITDQNLVDAQTATLRAAIDGLTLIGADEYFGAREGSTTKIAPNLQITGLKTELSKAELEEIFLDTNMDASQIKYTKAVRSAKYYGTGSTITVTYKNGKVEVYTIIIYGDVDGNGLVNYTDAGMVALAAEDNTFLDSVQQKAGNVDGMRRITATDAASIYKAADGDGFNQVNPAL